MVTSNNRHRTEKSKSDPIVGRITRTTINTSSLLSDRKEPASPAELAFSDSSMDVDSVMEYGVFENPMSKSARIGDVSDEDAQTLHDSLAMASSAAK